MDGEEGHVLLGAQAQKRHAEERRAGEIEGRAGVLPGDLRDVLIGRTRGEAREVNQRQARHELLGDNLDRPPLLHREARPQRLVPAHQLGQGAGEHRNV